MPARPISTAAPRAPGEEENELLRWVATSSRLANSMSKPRLRRSAPATARKLLEDVCRFAMWTSRGPCSWPQSENSGAPGEAHAGFGQEKGITGKRRQETGESAGQDGVWPCANFRRARRYRKPLTLKPRHTQSRRESLSAETWRPQKLSRRYNPSTLRVPEQPAYKVRWCSRRLSARMAGPYNSRC